MTIAAFTDSHITLDTIYTSDHDGRDAAIELLEDIEVEGLADVGCVDRAAVGALAVGA